MRITSISGILVDEARAEASGAWLDGPAARDGHGLPMDWHHEQSPVNNARNRFDRPGHRGPHSPPAGRGHGVTTLRRGTRGRPLGG